MRLAADVLQDVLDGFKRQEELVRFRPGSPSRLHRIMPKVTLAPRLRILPCCTGAHRRPLSVAVRSVAASGIVFVDQNYWMDGENFLLQLPHHCHSSLTSYSNSRALLCSVTNWQPIATDLFVISATFLRQVETTAFEPPRTHTRRPATEG